MLLYLLVIIVVAALVYVGIRAIRTQSSKNNTRVIGPDDDPDFLRRLNHGDK
ncbi:MAG: hypothetical protein K8R24_15345 [Mycobacterium sp.]|nr:hypothetical protein [Mycobacterium sp.]